MEHKHLRTEWKDEYTPRLRPGMSLHLWQKLGVTFLHHCRDKFGFALLGDEMGVGKVARMLKVVLIDRRSKHSPSYMETMNVS